MKNNKLTLKTLQRFKSERNNAFTEETNKIALNSNNDKRLIDRLINWLIELIEIYAYGTNKDVVCEKKN